MGDTENEDIALRRFHIYRHLRRLVHGMDSYRQGFARNFGLSGASLYLVFSIHKLPQCSYKDLAAYAGLAPNTVSTVVGSLISQGIVFAEPDVLDRRMIHLNLTDIGRRIVTDTWELMWAGDQTDGEAKHNQWVLGQLDEIQNLRSEM
jgi:DNA-binding MarR family transcriptional regulator